MRLIAFYRGRGTYAYELLRAHRRLAGALVFFQPSESVLATLPVGETMRIVVLALIAVMSSAW